MATGDQLQSVLHDFNFVTFDTFQQVQKICIKTLQLFSTFFRLIVVILKSFWSKYRNYLAKKTCCITYLVAFERFETSNT